MVFNGMRILLLSFLSVCADLRNLKIGKIKTMLVLEYEVCRVIALQWTDGPRSFFELLSKFIAKEAVIPDMLKKKGLSLFN
ncbi:hypothetical protein NC653_023390 [Populus alba x Populus x berolinensis]|uniref:Secreted protein n=1 Tax=Populus alba x Populus x berolinensis TaxID=444605 RepID=A0AAD6QAW8_9ROSI|nr:hypothetical protein NC653_023390 [Populus alba x Populus x berolinensis]